jgi:alginate O-acetyltransferase complex protein AlgI
VIFNSLTYLAFLLLVIPLYWLLGRRARLLLIFAAGVLFYGFWRFDFLAVLFFSIVFDYFSALVIADAKTERLRRLFLSASIAINLSLIAFFKYFYFLEEAAIGFASLFGLEIPKLVITIILPIGISFYTFHSMSYIIDVYRRHIEPTRDFILFVDYVIFFPQLVAGPILRAGEMLWQLDKRPAFVSAEFQNGLARIVLGLFLKVFVADKIATFVNAGFALDPARLSALDVMTNGFMFGFQIYFDFAAYSHIAIGTALLMGIKFPENFNYPYHAASPRIFWRRWHISLSSWIRDYVYLPLAGVKVQDRMSTGGIGIDGTGQLGQRSALLALFATWAIMGLWHGAAWTFVLWGLWHAALVAGHRVIEPLLARFRGRALTFVGWGTTLALVMIGWIPFRAPSLDYTLTAWGRLLDPGAWFALNLRESTYVVAALTLVATIAMPFGQRWLVRLRDTSPALSLALVTPGWIVIIALTFIYLRPLDQFIYFQF